ncbi:PHP domain-containing protein [Methanogenium sp. S4BF]|uniref:PHP domain-containing protein n=1 Tax=Methanogenium sp. S4BF TaxID=1789226 RepID=UPI00241719F5|nr:PHP domain-containing protein [Methanogenium sp. S4BF]WFN33717.1 PHP domain-containing protein [Methanogenium sp. S4BF]
MTPPEHIRLDMHVHSYYSSDASNSPKTIADGWKKYGILPIVCDHNSILGAEETYRLIREQSPDVPVILAEEILTSEGEIIGLFLNEEVPAYLTAAETLDIIRDQGAISIVPHPFCTYRSTAIRRDTLMELVGRIDIIEGYNARNVTLEANVLAQRLADEWMKPVSVGSDAHTPFELFSSYVGIEPFETPGELILNLLTAEVRYRKVHSSLHGISRLIKAERLAGGWNPVPGRAQ